MGVVKEVVGGYLSHQEGFRMRTHTALLLLAAVPVAACFEYGSINPAASPGHRVVVGRLVGEWRYEPPPSEGGEEQGPVCLRIEPPSGMTYVARSGCPDVEAPEQETNSFMLTRLGGYLVVELNGSGPDISLPDRALSTHHVHPIRLAGDSLWVWPLVEEQLDTLLSREPGLVAHIRPEVEEGPDLVITASSAELRAFYEAHLAALLGDSILLLRQAGAR